MIGVFVGSSSIFLLGILILIGLTARRLYKSFGVKGLNRPTKLPSPTFPVHYSVIIAPLNPVWAGIAIRYGPNGPGIESR
jgi:hypothetical protein